METGRGPPSTQASGSIPSFLGGPRPGRSWWSSASARRLSRWHRRSSPQLSTRVLRLRDWLVRGRSARHLCAGRGRRRDSIGCRNRAVKRHQRPLRRRPISRDNRTVEGFGYEWTKFDQTAADRDELEHLFQLYFGLFPWDSLPVSATGFDLGCGSGRWARFVVERVGRLICVDPSPEALRVAVRNAPKCSFISSAAGELPFRPGSMDFGYSLGVLHHVPDTAKGMADAVESLKDGAPFLVYLYYALDDRAWWFRAVWRATDLFRNGVSRSPTWVRYSVSQIIAAVLYLPLARIARLLERRGHSVESIPLSAYRSRTFYTMRTDALDRFGTRLEKRFSREQVRELMEGAGLERVAVDGPPFWAAIGFKPVKRSGPHLTERSHPSCVG
jgi:SAM-dependent methyltransferase